MSKRLCLVMDDELVRDLNQERARLARSLGFTPSLSAVGRAVVRRGLDPSPRPEGADAG